MNLPDPSRSRAVFIGVSDHADPDIPSYQQVAASARRFAELCRDDRLLGLPAAHCTELCGPAAVKPDIEEAIEDAAAAAEDLLLIYYGGHGLRTEGGLLLSTRHSRVSPRQRWLSFETLKGMVAAAATRADRVVVVLDCCFAGQAKTVGLRNDTDPVTGERMSVLWTATGATENAWVEVDGEYTNFAASMFAAMESGVESAPELLGPASLHEHLDADWSHQRHRPDLLTTGNSTLPLFRNLAARAPRNASRRARLLIDEPEPLFGRDEVVGQILDHIRDRAAAERVPVVCGIQGPPGMGKSSTARQIASELSAEFGEAQYLIDLQGWNPKLPAMESGEVIEHLVRDMAGHQVYPADDQGRLSQWRQWMLERTAVVVFDNVADPQILERCLPPRGARCVMLVTSREDVVERLPHAASFTIGGLADADARALLSERAHREFTESQVGLLVDRFGRSPQTLGTVGSALRGGMDPGRFVAAVDSIGTGHDPESAAKEAFLVSVRSFANEEQRAMWACGRHPGPSFSPASISAMVTGSESGIELVLRNLVTERFLLEPVGESRFAFHDRYGKYAAELADSISAELGDAMVRKLFRSLLARLRGARQQFAGIEIEQSVPEATRRTPAVRRFRDAAAAREWLASSSEELEAAAAEAVRMRWQHAAQLVKYVVWWMRFDSRMNRARALLEQLAASDRLIDQAEAWKGLGAVCLLLDEYDDAASWMRQAQQSYALLGDDIGQADAMQGLGDAALGHGDTMAAARHYGDAQALHRRQGNRRGQANAWKGLGMVSLLRDEYRLSAQHYRDAADAFRDMGDRLGQADATRGLGDVARLLDDYETAAEHYGEAQDVYRDLADRRGQATCWQSLGDNARLWGDYRQAAMYYREAELLHGDLGDRLGQADAWWGLGTVAQMGEEYGRAEQYFRSAQGVYTELGSVRGQADAWWSLGHTARLSGDLDTAEHNYQAAVETYREFGSLIGQADSWWGLADTARERGDLDTAERFYRDAEEAHRQLDSPRGLANMWFGLGETARLRGDLDAAERFYRDAERTYADTGNLLGRAECRRSFAELALARGDKAAAVQCLDEAIGLYRESGAEAKAAEAEHHRDELDVSPPASP